MTKSMDSLPPLNALRVFDVTGRVGSITDAATALCVTPAAVSRQIRLLETHLGVRLFDRQHRRIVLTEAGAHYHAEISRQFAGILRATRDLNARSRPNVFVIKAPHSVAMRWLLPRLSAFLRDASDVEVKVNTSVVPPDFEREDIDAGIVWGSGRWKGLSSYKIMRNELVAVCAPGKFGHLRRPADLAGQTLLHTMARPDFWQVWLKAAGRPHLPATRDMHYESSALAFEAALEGQGIAIAQKALVQRDLDEGRLVMPFPLAVDLGTESYYFVLPPEGYKRRSAALQQFRSWIEACEIQ